VVHGDAPHDLDAERALIGAAILDPAVPDAVALDPDDLYLPRHISMWRYVTGLNGAHPDRARGLLDRLIETGELKDGYLDGPYIHECIQACVTPAGAPQYARVIRRHARRRRIIEALTRGLQQATTGTDDDVEAPAAEAMAALAAVLSVGVEHQAPTTWEPLPADDVRRLLAGEEIDPPPTILPRADGQCLIYPQRVHVFAGEPGSGKTFLACVGIASELAAGRRAAMIDFEDRAAGVYSRLRGLGCTEDQLVTLFRYSRPRLPLTERARLHLELAISGASLVIIDGVTEAMTAEGLKPGDLSDVATFYGRLPRVIADHGPAVVLIDHVPKDKETRGSWAIGSQHKIAGVDGCTYTLEAIDKFGRGKVGLAKVLVGRDRPGHVEGFALGRQVTVFRLDATEPASLGAELRVPEEVPVDPGTGEKRPTGYMGRVNLWLLQNPGSKREEIVKGVGGKAEYVKHAINALAREGWMTHDPGPHGAKLYRVARSYDPEAEERGDYDREPPEDPWTD
jgi:AAA domain/DnaB-like helicase N terminal domain